VGRLRTTSSKQAKMRRRGDGDAEARQRATRQAAIHDDTRVPLEPTPDGLGVKVIASTYQRRGLGLQSDGARCYNSQEFYG